MRFRVLLVFIATLFIVSACNLGGTSNQGEETIDDDSGEDLGQPVVTILSPENGANFTVNEQISVSVGATDSLGITRVQLFANGSLVRTVSSEFENGEVSYEGLLDFTPRSEGDYTLRVIAYRNAISSPPADLTVSVGTQQVIVTERPNDTGSNTGSTGNTVPVIPNDGVCRALTLVGLNMRTQPTTTRDNVITTFQANTLLNVVARLGDNSWWKVQSGATVGWVSGDARFVSLSGNCNSVAIENVVLNTPTPFPTNTAIPTNIPAPTNTPVPTNTSVPGMPDLIVPSISIDDEIVIPNGETEVTVEVTMTVKNDGTEETGQFSVILTVEGGGLDDVVYDVATVGGLEQGSIVTLTQEVTFTAVGEYDIQVDVDPTDVIDESGEFNNRADTTVDVVAAP